MTTAFQAITPCRELGLLLPCHPWTHADSTQSIVWSPGLSWFQPFFLSIFSVSTRGCRCCDKELFLSIRYSTVERTQSSPDGTRHNKPFATKHANMVSPSPHYEGILREAQLSSLSFQVQV